MFHSQPIELTKEQMAKYEINKDINKEQKVINTEIVDDIFDFSNSKITIAERIKWLAHRISDKWSDFKWSIKNYFVWKKVINGYRPWDIRCFLPMFEKHLKLYIDQEKKYGIAAKEFKDYKIATAQEALSILGRLLSDDYNSVYTEEVNKKWGKFPY